MIVGFVLILSIVGISLATALYSNFLPYFSLLSDVKNYNMAYYGANTAIERSLLVLRYQEAGFEGTGGRKNNINDVVASDQLPAQFGYYNSDTTLERVIKGRPTDDAIPGTGQGNIDYYFLSGRTNDFNALDYRIPQRIPLWVDSTENENAYNEDTERTSFVGNSFALRLQLSPSIKSKFGELDTTNDNYGNGVQNDVIVDWGWKGQYENDNGGWSDFSIIPRSLVAAVNGSSTTSLQSSDESIRESDISDGNLWAHGFLFQDNINPLYYTTDGDSPRSSTMNTHLMIGDNSNRANVVRSSSFTDLLGSSTVKDNELTFLLTKTLFSQAGNIYPFLEYKVDLEGRDQTTISQPYFTINGKSQIGNYTVQMDVKKSINKNDTLGSFTVVF